MKFNLKKYVYFVNDITNVLLKKDRVEEKEVALKLRTALIIVSIILVLSIIINFYLYNKYV